MKKIPIDESCFICGETLTLHTEAEQDRGPEYDWWCDDGDEAACSGCGGVFHVSCDEDGAEVMDTDTHHNRQCQNAFDRRSP